MAMEIVCGAEVMPRRCGPRSALKGVITRGVVVPAPVRDIVCGLDAALCWIVRVPLRVPDESGVKVKFTVQLEEAASDGGQL